MQFRSLLTATTVLLSMQVTPAAAQTTGDSSAACNAKATLYFGNGILTQFGSARASLDRLRTGVEASLGETERGSVTYELAYNATGGAISDIWEAIKQRQELASIDLSTFLLIIAGLYDAPPSVQATLRSAIAERIRTATVNSADLGKHVQLYKNAIGSGRKVVIVAHSQGNLFANLAYSALTASERTSFGIVSVANPSSSVAGGGPYTTLSNDAIISLIPLALPFNTSNGFTAPFYDFTGHFFLESYYRSGTNSHSRITNGAIQAIRQLQAPQQIFNQGAIRATLTWGSSPDVDLHAYEPNGAHVYYNSLRGPSGYLDLDDVSGFGPENYFVSCQTVETGSYRIGVNYFSGSTAETARVEIRAGGTSTLITQSLSSARGAEGDNSPVIVATVRVSRDANGVYSYSIEK